MSGEVLHNGLHHAQATHIEVEIHNDASQLRLRVRDDGKGIESQVMEDDGRTGQWGLHGMRERAKIIGGNLEVWSSVQSGTEVELTIPSSTGYNAPIGQGRSWFSRRDQPEVVSENRTIRILAVDDHPVFRQGIAGLIADQRDMTLVAEASNGREAIQQFRTHHPDITLMDLQMPEMNGIDAVITIRNEFPDARIVVLTTYTGDVQVLRALKAGARGYLVKDLLHKELLETIRAVHAGKKALSPEACHEIASHATDDPLSPAEVSVLRLIAAGNANKQIAAQLSITEETVKGRVKSILSKLGANDRTHAAMIGLKRGIIEL